MVKSYTLAGTAAFVCLVLAICAVISTVHILDDISDFYIEAQEELAEFKDIANNVWDEMVFESTPEEMRQAEDSNREKRSYEEGAYDVASSSTTSTTTSTTTAESITESGGEESGYDFGHDNGPPSSRPRKPNPPTMPRTIQGFRAPPPAATSTYRPPNGRNYDNYGREPASSRRPYPPYQSQQSSTSSPQNTSNNRTFYKPESKQQTSVYPPNTRSPYNPPINSQSPQNPRAPHNPDYPQPSTAVPNTLPPRQPSGGYDSDRQTPPTWPKVYNTRRPNYPGYPEDQHPTVPPVTGQQRISPTQTHYPNNPHVPDRNYPRPPTGSVPPSTGIIPPLPPFDETLDRTGSRPGFGPQRPRFPSNTRQRVNACDQCSSQPNTCPSGPPGPRGRPGPPGFPGQDGPRGLRGLNGGYSGVHPASYDPVIGCVQCPVGPPGERGPDGPPGPPGEDGIDGEQGNNGNDGQPGAPGAPGYHGINGVPGTPGKPGTPGRNGQACKSIPGPPGTPGAPGVPGRAGDPGIDGEHGQDGSPGIQGPPGKDGNPGVEGPAGTSAPGVPGSDGGYCPCPKRSSKYDFADVGYTVDDKKPQKLRPVEQSVEQEETSRRQSRPENYVDNAEYERQRRPTYEPSEEIPQRRNRYDDDERPREEPRDYVPEHQQRRPPPQRQQPRDEMRYPGEYDRQLQENREYASEKPKGYSDDRRGAYEEERPRPRPEEGHSSGYGGDQRQPQIERRPIEGARYETDSSSPTLSRPLKKVEINRNSDRGYESRPPPSQRQNYEDDKARRVEESHRYETDSELSVEVQRKDVHPPGFRRSKTQEERREHRPNDESLPPLKQTDRFNGEKRTKNPEYEDISKSDREELTDKHQRKPNKFQEKQWEEHRKSQELRNSREHGGQVPAENTARMEQVRPEERQTSEEEKPLPAVHDNFQSSEKRAFSNENPLPSEQLPYRRKTRFYRTHYYEKFLV